ncbi:hypothetical protein KF707_21040, partial [Candidatus Obscuribacterales bacterium]|nr:hypothetical protein [Candidatus Obscuribacterales bacterium]
MMSSKESSIKRKRQVAIAIMFASGSLFSTSDVIAKQPAADGSTLQYLVSNTALSNEVRAYYLLRLADSYIEGDGRARSVSLEMKAGTRNPLQYFGFVDMEGFYEDVSYSYAKYLLTQSLAKKTSDKAESNSLANDEAAASNMALADDAIQAALKELKQSSNEPRKLNLYFAASKILQKKGDLAGSKRCEDAFNDMIRDAESSDKPKPELVAAANAIFGLLAKAILPVQIPTFVAGSFGEQPLAPLASPPAEAILDSEALLLRGLKLVDRLPSSDHNRRKAHRDMVLWYRQVGMMPQAEEQKLILFSLVGIE